MLSKQGFSLPLFGKSGLNSKSPGSTVMTSYIMVRTGKIVVKLSQNCQFKRIDKIVDPFRRAEHALKGQKGYKLDFWVILVRVSEKIRVKEASTA